MNDNKITIFLTGITGNMGKIVFENLLEHENFYLKVLVRPSSINKKKLSQYENNPNIEIIWGDLLDYSSVLKGIENADYVVHIGGMVSPFCEKKPYLTLKTNITSAKNITKAILSLPNRDKMKVCYIGSVAETGSRNYPIHWGRTGDPIKASIFDHYALSKIIAERVFVESGIKNWVVLRLSGIIYPNILKQLEPIAFHVPLNGVLEWCTVEDSGKVIEKMIIEDLNGKLNNKNFWNHFFNVGSGEIYRITNYEFEDYILTSLGLPGPKSLFNPDWFAIKNFHGHYYADSDKLEDLLHFRENLPIKDYFARLTTQVEFYFGLSKYIPNFLIGPAVKLFMKRLCNTKKFGTMDWKYNKDNDRITAHFGSYECWEKIGQDWNNFELKKYETKTSESEKYKLNHGYDENKDENELDINDMKKAAEFRGGEVLSKTMKKGDLQTKLKWKCNYCKNEFDASPCLILLGGHWCPNCYIPEKKWDYDNIAKINPFFAQVWYNDHNKDENNSYSFDEIFQENGKKWDDIY